MKRKILFLFLSVIILLAISHSAEAWEWSSDPTFEGCASQLHGSPYAATLASDRFGKGTAEIKNSEGKILYRWPAHRFTSFVIHGERLYYSGYSPIAPEITMRCVDLSTQREVWHMALPEDGPAFNSEYSNRVNIAPRDDKLLVFSRQSWSVGEFSWKLAPDTGKLLQ